MQNKPVLLSQAFDIEGQSISIDAQQNAENEHWECKMRPVCPTPFQTQGQNNCKNWFFLIKHCNNVECTFTSTSSVIISLRGVCTKNLHLWTLPGCPSEVLSHRLATTVKVAMGVHQSDESTFNVKCIMRKDCDNVWWINFQCQVHDKEGIVAMCDQIQKGCQAGPMTGWGWHFLHCNECEILLHTHKTAHCLWHDNWQILLQKRMAQKPSPNTDCWWKPKDGIPLSALPMITSILGGKSRMHWWWQWALHSLQWWQLWQWQ